MQNLDVELPFGPQSGLYFLQSVIDPYSPEARAFLQKKWRKEHASTLLSNAIKKGIPFEHVSAA